jgi:hypothetical protein
LCQRSAATSKEGNASRVITVTRIDGAALTTAGDGMSGPIDEPPSGRREEPARAHDQGIGTSLEPRLCQIVRGTADNRRQIAHGGDHHAADRGIDQRRMKRPTKRRVRRAVGRHRARWSSEPA